MGVPNQSAGPDAFIQSSVLPVFRKRLIRIVKEYATSGREKLVF